LFRCNAKRLQVFLVSKRDNDSLVSLWLESKKSKLRKKIAGTERGTKEKIVNLKLLPLIVPGDITLI
jgi:hypothetical protein